MSFSSDSSGRFRIALNYLTAAATIVFNLDIVDGALRSHSDDWLIWRVDWLWWLLKEGGALICRRISIVVWEHLVCLMSIVRYKNLVVNSLWSLYGLFQITNQILLLLSQVNIQRLFNRYVLPWNRRRTHMILVEIWDCPVLINHLVVLIEENTELSRLAVCHSWELSPAFLLLLS